MFDTCEICHREYVFQSGLRPKAGYGVGLGGSTCCQSHAAEIDMRVRLDELRNRLAQSLQAEGDAASQVPA